MSIKLYLSAKKDTIYAVGNTFTIEVVAHIERNGKMVSLHVAKANGKTIVTEEVPGKAFAKAVKARIEQLEFQDECRAKDITEKETAWAAVLAWANVSNP